MSEKDIARSKVSKPSGRQATGSYHAMQCIVNKFTFYFIFFSLAPFFPHLRFNTHFCCSSIQIEFVRNRVRSHDAYRTNILYWFVGLIRGQKHQKMHVLSCSNSTVIVPTNHGVLFPHERFRVYK